jgi:hypothetical protein
MKRHDTGENKPLCFYFNSLMRENAVFSSPSQTVFGCCEGNQLLVYIAPSPDGRGAANSWAVGS